MDGLWTHAGLNLRMNAYGCVATAAEEGMLEVVPASTTIAAVVTSFTTGLARASQPPAQGSDSQPATDAGSAAEVRNNNLVLQVAGWVVVGGGVGGCNFHRWCLCGGGC